MTRTKLVVQDRNNVWHTRKAGGWPVHDKTACGRWVTLRKNVARQLPTCEECLQCLNP